MGMAKPPLVDGRETMMQTASHLSRKQLQVHSSDDMPSNLGAHVVANNFLASCPDVKLKIDECAVGPCTYPLHRTGHLSTQLGAKTT